MIKQSQLLKIKSQILSNLFNEKYGLRLGEFNNTTGTERVIHVLIRMDNLLVVRAEIYVKENVLEQKTRALGLFKKLFFKLILSNNY